MSNKLILLKVRGREKSWAFVVTADPQHLPEWRAGGWEGDE